MHFEVSLQAVLHAGPVYGVEVEVVHAGAVGDKGFDLGEGGEAPDVDGQEGRRGGGGVWWSRREGGARGGCGGCSGAIWVRRMRAGSLVGVKSGPIAICADEDGGGEEVDQDGACSEKARG